MSGQHTQGRVTAIDFSGSSDLELDDGTPIAVGLNPADARRLAACWNAFDGFDTATVELLVSTGAIAGAMTRSPAHAQGIQDALRAAQAECDQLRAELAQLQLQLERDAARALLREALDEFDADAARIRAEGDFVVPHPRVARIRALLADEDTFTAAERVRAMAKSAVDTAARWGYVLTITQSPKLPLAMGNYETVVAVRPARGAA